MKQRVRPSVARLHEVLSYDPAGAFTWKVTMGNRAVAGTAVAHKGRAYHTVTIDQHVCYAHRIAWALMTGEWPCGIIDHKNGDRGDNAWSNLRMATNAQNGANSVLCARNKSGFRGVHWHGRSKRWIAQITINGEKTRHLGLFSDLAEAAAAYDRVAREVYGEFHRANPSGWLP